MPFIGYVPDNVINRLIKGITSDNYFFSVNATREDEAMGMAAGAWMGGMKSGVLMQREISSARTLARTCL
jgi:sulfopyruvate decarboxylase TPP-binding subunit